MRSLPPGPPPSPRAPAGARRSSAALRRQAHRRRAAFVLVATAVVAALLLTVPVLSAAPQHSPVTVDSSSTSVFPGTRTVPAEGHAATLPGTPEAAADTAPPPVPQEAAAAPAPPAPEPASAPEPVAPAPPPAPSAPVARTAAGAPTPGPAENQVLQLVNEHRAQAGCGPLTADAGLAAVATAHSAAMRDLGFFSHNDPNGRDPFARAEAAGQTARAENIARGQQDAAAVVQAWMDSPGHRANILDCSLRRHGLGLVTGPTGPWWTQLFG
ncbi:hypothetical protein DQ244_10375 [Blastococcus sp. TBT05-19]|uniref:CAP domain-containing protein n=1 Tax=Blastococcus sp. TBT05-19 TaxID=2250581 RepID=UPI000DF9E674|nr:CAP domain-containing protein [Blastococcus sp. TBT05-19]RBY91693.1 hypothetical protein DQ244_10375 [Blastococcus sp. TBT05-19]